VNLIQDGSNWTSDLGREVEGLVNLIQNGSNQTSDLGREVEDLGRTGERDLGRFALVSVL